MSFNGIECKFRVEKRNVEIGMKFGFSIFGWDIRRPEGWTPMVTLDQVWRTGCEPVKKRQRALMEVLVLKAAFRAAGIWGLWAILCNNGAITQSPYSLLRHPRISRKL